MKVISLLIYLLIYFNSSIVTNLFYTYQYTSWVIWLNYCLQIEVTAWFLYWVNLGTATQSSVKPRMEASHLTKPRPPASVHYYLQIIMQLPGMESQGAVFSSKATEFILNCFV